MDRFSSPSGGSRRKADRALSQTLARVGDSLAAPLDAVVGGRLLLTAVAVAVAVSSPWLRPDGKGWSVLLAVTAALVVVSVASPLVPWSRLPRYATMAFPAAVCAALVAISVGSPGLVASLSGLLALCFGYIGLTQSPWVSLLVLPAAAATFITVNGGFSNPTTVRLVVNLCVWVLLAELLARFTVRQAALSWELRRLARTDALTGLGNRRDLDDRMSRANRGDALIICDLDNFKTLNGKRGHQAGDRVLAAFGALLRAEMRTEDYCARYGGEEFFLLLPETGSAQAEAVLARLHEVWAKLQPTVTFSAGLAVCRAGRTHAATLTAADQALRAAKDSGRNADRVAA